MCGLVHLVRLVGSSSSESFVNLTWRLEEARLEKEETRARQKEYDELAFKQAKMERTI